MAKDNMSEKTIHFIITGGTFDKHYDEIRGELTFKHTHLSEILDFVRCAVPLTFEINQLTDSLDMDDSARGRILKSCTTSEARRIVVIHGTDTMTETAALIGREGLDKTIVLTGAMVPYSISRSDALFNLGAAVSAVQLLSAGCYICMNGRVFPWKGTAKDKTNGTFEGPDLTKAKL